MYIVGIRYEQIASIQTFEELARIDRNRFRRLISVAYAQSPY